jgi:hypothetical protein
MIIHRLIEKLIRDSEATKPTVVIRKGTACSAAQIKAWERKHKIVLPDDYKIFVQSVGECFLHVAPGGPTHTCAVRFMPITEVDRYRKIVSNDKIEDISDSWYAFADHHDNNWIAFDLATVKGSKVDVYDGCWEIACQPDEWEILARSFGEFLERIMKTRGTSPMGGNGLGFWQE